MSTSPVVRIGQSEEIREQADNVKSNATEEQQGLHVDTNGCEDGEIDGRPGAISAPVDFDEQSQHDHGKRMAANGFGALGTDSLRVALVNGGVGDHKCAITLAAKGGVVVVGVTTVWALFHESGPTTGSISLCADSIHRGDRQRRRRITPARWHRGTPAISGCVRGDAAFATPSLQSGECARG